MSVHQATHRQRRYAVCDVQFMLLWVPR